MKTDNWFYIVLFVTVNVFGQNVPIAPSVPLFSDSTQSQNAIEPPSELELLQISGHSKFSKSTVHVGDTLSYSITIEWHNPKVPVMVLAPESLSFDGFVKKSASTDHKKVSTIKEGQMTLTNRTVFTYHLKAQTPGSGRASKTILPYYSAISKEHEYYSISPSLIDILPAKISLQERPFFKLILGLFLIGLISGGVYLFVKKKSKQTASKPDAGPNYITRLTQLKSRLQTGESKSILMEMEQIAIAFLSEKLNKSADTKLETLLDVYLTNAEASTISDWNKLKEDYELAKFGGGQKARHELTESYHLLKQCLGIKGEDTHE